VTIAQPGAPSGPVPSPLTVIAGARPIARRACTLDHARASSAESSMPLPRMAERRFRTMRRPRVTST